MAPSGRTTRSRKSGAAAITPNKDPPPPSTSRRSTSVTPAPPPSSSPPPPPQQQSQQPSNSKTRSTLDPSTILPELATDELVRRLKAAASELQNLKQQDKEGEYDDLLPFCLHLTDDRFLSHASPDVRLLVACCLADMLRVFAPEAPFKDPHQIKSIFKFLVSQLEGVRNVKGMSFKRYYYLLENLSVVKCFTMVADLEDEDTQEIFIALLEVIFSSVSEEHSDKVKTVMINLLEPLLTDSHAISYELLDVILKNILKPAKTSRKPAYQLARDLLLKCSESLEPFIQALLTAALVGNTEELESISVAARVYDLMTELHLITPSILQGSLPQLEYKLKSLETEDRLSAVNLVARIFSAPDYATPFTSTPLWQAFLGRFNDISVEIRTSLVEHSQSFVLNQPESRKDIEECLAQRLHDSDERVRLEVVKTVISIATDPGTGFDYVRKNPQLLECVKERTLDKKLKIRYQALQGLGHIYKMYLEKSVEEEEGPPSWIHSRILQGYYLEQVEDRALIERLLNTCMVPYTLESRDRMVQLIYLCSTADANAYKAFVEVQKKNVLVRRHLADLVNSVMSPSPDKDLQMKALNHRIGILSKFLPNPALGSEFIPALINDMKESKGLASEMELIVKASSDCKTVRENVNKVLKRMGEPVGSNVKYATVKTILERSASVLIDKEAIQELLKIVSDLVAGSSQPEMFQGRDFPAPALLIEKCCTLVSALAFLFAAHFDHSSALELMVNLLQDENLDAISSSNILSALVFIGKQTRPLGHHRKDLMGTLTKHCLSLLDIGSPRQGKMAVRCLHSNLADEASQNEIFNLVLGKIETNLQDPSRFAYPTAVVCLGHVALLMPTEFKEDLKTLVSRHVIKNLLVNPQRSARDAVKNPNKIWVQQESLPVVTRCMTFGIKTVARWIVGTRTDLTSSKQAFKMLTTFVERGSVQLEEDPFPFSDSEKAWLRLAAGCGMLKIAQQKRVGDQYDAYQICALAELMTDPVDQVRFKFAAKLHKCLSRGIPDKCLPLDFLGFYVLAAFEPNKKQRGSLKQFMNTDIRLRRDYIKMLMTNHPDKDKAAGQLPALMPDYLLGYAIAILANNSHFKEPQDLDELNDLRRCLQFVVEPLVKGGVFVYSFYEKLLEGIRNRRNAVDPDSEEANARLYVVCDLASELMVKHQRLSSSGLEEYPAEVYVPRVYFRRHEDPEWRNTTDSFLPEEYLRASAKRKGIGSPGRTPKVTAVPGKSPGRGGSATPKRGGRRGGEQRKRGRDVEETVEGEEEEIDAGPTDAKRTRLEELDEGSSPEQNGSQESSLGEEEDGGDDDENVENEAPPSPPKPKKGARKGRAAASVGGGGEARVTRSSKNKK